MKKDIRKEITNRNYHITKRLWYFIYRNVMRIVGKKYHPHYEKIDDINDCKGPCFVIFNHLSRLDHMYVMEIAYPRRVNILCSYGEFFRSHLHFAFKHNNVLPKKPYVNDILSTRIMRKMINLGACIAFAPEGLATNDGMNKPIVPGTGHMLKHYKLPVYFVCLRGQHLLNTKACLDIRSGNTFATSSLLLSPADLEAKSTEEIDEIINNAFRHDEYAWNKEKHYKYEGGGRMCYHLEDLLYRCPKCGAEFKMAGVGNKFTCEACGNGAELDEYYDFHPYDDSCVIPNTISEWVNGERIQIIKDIRKDSNYTYSDHIKLGKLPNDHYLKNKATSEIVANGLLSLDHNGLHFRGEDTSNHDFDLNWKQLYTVISIQDAQSFNIYVDNEYVDIFPDSHCMMKWSILIEEMHRLHVNFYKNHPWNNYMYENVD